MTAGVLVLTACAGEDGQGADGATGEPSTAVTTTVTATDTPTEPPTQTATGASDDTRTVTVPATPTRTTTPPDTSAPASPTPTPSTPASRPFGTPDLAAKQRAAPAPHGLMVSRVRVGGHGGFDRVVFDFAGEGSPGWYINYTETPTQQGSGAPVDYEGEIALLVGIDGTPYPDELGLEFPDLGTTPGTGNVTEVIYTSLFEARTEFVIGVRDRLPYSVTVLENPTRLVIDIVDQ